MPIVANREEIENFCEYSEMLANTQQSQELISPSEFGNTPKSTYLENKSNFNPDASFDYSIIQIEFMADNATGSITPQNNKQQSRDLSQTLKKIYEPQTQKNSNDKFKIQDFPSEQSNLVVNAKKRSQIFDTCQEMRKEFNATLKQSLTNNDHNSIQKLTKANLEQLDDSPK